MTSRLRAVIWLLVSLLALPSSADEQFWEYTFRPGDSIWSIARDYTNSVDNWSEIQRVNQIDPGSDRQIQPGTRIKIPLTMLKTPPQPAIVTAVNGGAELIRVDGEVLNVSADARLYAGDRLLTGAGQSLTIRFADGSILQVFENSEVILDKLSYHEDTGMVDTQLRLQQGRVNNWVEKLRPGSRYQLQTPSAVTAVRGTVYRVTSDAAGISRTEVTEGSVGVSSGGETREVASGFGIVVEKGKPLPQPVKLLAAPQLGLNQSRRPFTLEVGWQALAGALSYRYQVALNADFSLLVADRATQNTRFELSNLEAGVYHVRVRAINDSGLEGLNAIRQFTIAAAIESNHTMDEVIIPSGILLLGQ